jgi:hypothetical protein
MARHGRSRSFAFPGNPEFFYWPSRTSFFRRKSLANELLASVAHYPRSDTMITIELTIDGKNSPGLMYVNIPVFFGPERLAQFTELAKSFLRAMTLERSPGFQAKIR